MSEQIRQPIIAVVGHVDHGKTSFLDRIRQTTVVEKEPGQITQAIGASVVPKNVIEKICGEVLEKFKFTVEVPGLLFIDTPGHEAFTSLRRRGGALADLAVLVVDIMEGLMPQTEESLRILREEKTPFLIAINKIDRIRGWAPGSYMDQRSEVMQEFEEKFYKVIEQISLQGFSADRFDRVADFRSTVAAVPMSGKTGEGIPEVLAVLVGLSQVFLKDKLKLTSEGRGYILEVKETTGLGTTADVILYDGSVSKGDWIAVGGQEPFVTKAKALLMPKPLREIRVDAQFQHVDQCTAACGVKISAPEMEKATAGAEIVVKKSREEAEAMLKEFELERKEVEVHRDTEGLVVKTDTIGSLEALLNVLKDYPVEDATIGSITKQDVLVASNNEDKNRVIVAFNVKPSKEIQDFAKANGVKIIETDVIYRIIDVYKKFIEDLAEELRKKEIADLTRPSQVTIMPGYVFRQNNPAIAGCEIRGVLKPGYTLMKEGKGTIGTVKQIQKDGKNVDEAVTGDKVAVSIDGATIGRQIEEGDTLFSDVSSADYKKLTQFRDLLSGDEKIILEKIAEIKRKEDRRYGII